MRAAWWPPLALALALAGAAAVHAEPPTTAVEDASVAMRDAKWTNRLLAATMRRDRARQRVLEAEAAVSEARHRQYPRGEALTAIENERDKAKEELAEAEEEIPDLLERARADGVSPAVLMRFEPEAELPGANDDD
jgi:hypothetical protein